MTPYWLNIKTKLVWLRNLVDAIEDISIYYNGEEQIVDRARISRWIAYCDSPEACYWRQILFLANEVYKRKGRIYK